MSSSPPIGIVSFWHGPLDRLRRLCLASQVAAGHPVIVYSFGALPDLPAGVRNADANDVLPQLFAERIRRGGLAVKPGWTVLQFSDFFRMRLMAQGAGRLVRASGDRGVVAVLDQRLATARYGSYLKASLPDFWYTTDCGQVRKSLAAIDAVARQTEAG